jgi:hypothetical protein
MNCLTCTRAGSDSVAVALCPNCLAGLCLDHVRQATDTSGPGGMNYSCNHDTWNAAWRQGPQAHVG